MADNGYAAPDTVTVPEGNGDSRSRELTVAICLPILAGLAVLYTAYFAKGLFIPFFLSVFFSCILWPAVAAMNRVLVPIGIGAAIATFLPPLIVGGAIHLATPSAEVWRYRVPAFVYQMELKLDTVFDSVKRAREIARQANDLASGNAPANGAAEPKKEETPRQEPVNLDVLWSVPATIGVGIVTLILTYFMLVAGPGLARWAVGDPTENRRTLRLAVIARQSLRDISKYYRTVAVINVGLGLAVWGAMAALGMPEPHLWSGMICVFNFIPYIGPIAAGAIITIVSIIEFDSTLRIVLPPLAFTAITFVEGYFITPWLVGKALTLNPLLVLLSLLFWGWMWGLAGVFLAIPLVAVIIRLGRFAASESVASRTPAGEAG